MKRLLLSLSALAPLAFVALPALPLRAEAPAATAQAAPVPAPAVAKPASDQPAVTLDKAGAAAAATPSGAPPSLATDGEDGKIGQVVAQILERAHYLQRPFDDAMSHLFLKMYEDVLDYRHMVFLQTDLDEFEQKYGAQLNKLTLTGDITPSRDIYNRFLQRLGERQAYVDKILKSPVDFTKDESVLTDRSKAPWPKDQAEADELWRLQVKFELLEGLLSKKNPADTAKKISERYGRMLKTMTKDFDHTELLGSYLSALTHSYDPHSDYFTPEDADNFTINAIKMSLRGIGAVLRTVDGYPEIVSLVPGGPADLDGRLKAKDRIIAVAQEKEKPVDVVDMKLRKVVDMIRGAPKTKVTLTVIPADSADSAVHKDIVLTRDEVKLTYQKAQARLYEQPGSDGTVRKYGVIVLPEFYQDASDDVANLIKQLKKQNISGLVLDLRRDTGGILDEAIKITSLFVQKGPVVQVKNPQGKVNPFPIGDSSLIYTGPLVVAVSKSSASASEIVAAALQDYGRALIVGDKTTFGKGTVQTLIDLKDINWGFAGDPGKLKVTVQKFYRITGDTTQYKGVSSDIVLPSLDDVLDLGEAQLPNALAADQVDPAKFKRVAPSFPSLADLQAKSQARVAKSQDYAFLQKEIDLLKPRLDTKTLSLNLEQRRVEKQASETLKDEHDKALAARAPTDRKVYLLDLAMLDKGLPPQLAVPKAAKADGAAKAKAPKKDGPDATDGLDGENDDDGSDGLPNSAAAALRDFGLDETVQILSDYADKTGKTPLGAN